MSKKAPAPPPPPDPVATARAQAEFNTQAARENAELNRINQRTPYGNLTYAAPNNAGFNEEAYFRANPDVAASGMRGLDHYRMFGMNEGRQGVEGYNPTAQWTVETTLSPEQRRLYEQSVAGQTIYGDAGLSQLRGVQDTLSRPFEFRAPPMQTDLPNRTFAVRTSVPDRTGGMTFDLADRTGEIQRTVQDRTGEVMRRADFTGIGDPNQSRDAVEAALFARMNPQLEAQRAALEARLVNQGITPGSQAWETGMRDFAQMANDARLATILNAGQEQSRVFGLGFGQAELNNAGVGQQMANDLQRGQFANAATAQAAEMDLARGNFANAARGQAAGMDLANAGFANQAQQQLFGMDIGMANFANAARQQSLQEQLALRAQPLNEAAALLSGQQVQNPQFVNVPQVQVQAPDYQGAVGQNYAGQVSNWNAQSQRIGQQNAAFAQLLGQAGGAVVGGLRFTPASGFSFGR